MSATDLAAVARGDGRSGPGSPGGGREHATVTMRFAARYRVDGGESRAYRHTLLSSPGIEEYISGVTLYDETIRPARKSVRPQGQAP
ncbi:MAG TPA: hypothetical protein VMZ73_03000 [Acidimicrobiales bacterium]|nr:hypothetical protein [Acidimicrobiales bacterium]